MSEATLTVQVESLEAQLAVLKAQVKRLIAPAPRKTFGDLYGILAGKVSSTEEEIDAVRYRFEGESTAVITKDADITASGLVNVIW